MATAEEYIKSMYDSKKKSTLAGLESAYKQNVGKLDQEDKEAPKLIMRPREMRPPQKELQTSMQTREMR